MIVPVLGDDLRPGSCIVIGAGLIAMRDDWTVHRRARQTYGLSISVPYDPAKHPPEKAYVNSEGAKRVIEFEVLVRYNELIPEPFVKTYVPETAQQEYVSIPLLATYDLRPVYPDPPSVRVVGNLRVPLPKNVDDRSVQVSIDFRREEIVAEMWPTKNKDAKDTKNVDFLYGKAV
eukprot:TRINITY_DN1060_c0_g1_i3.p3 TRINITY_DN1060_c0_g1~~TRINITY_DN1060_c0_g1_i3.p3  ORF type:complete len:175 (+),score=58.68 TRINITY_DN1060_c0_g1_i3:247-771(+)